jgi:hypothetical protein
MEVRSFERKLELCSFCFTACRARLRACAVLAIFKPCYIKITKYD